jgi:uncharacterized membrane protein (UPF0136 family)
MSLKRTLLAIAVVMVLFLPVGRLLRDANPLTCFAFTNDENFFAQAASQWSEGHGYRMAEGALFDPLITVGVPMAWGASAIHGWTGEDIAHSGRDFAYLCFVLLLVVLARTAYRNDRNWLAIPVTLGLFGFGLSKISYGSYFVFGFFGEMPGLLLAALAYRAVDDRRYVRAGLLAVGVFIFKPTFVLFLPALAVAALLHSPRAAWRSGSAIAVGLGAYLYAVAQARGESLFQYLAVFFRTSSMIARAAPRGSPLDLYAGLDIPALFSIAFLLFGAFSVYRSRKVAPSSTAAFLLFAGAGLSFFFLGQRPVEKQWSALFTLALVGFVVPWGSAIAARVSGWVPDSSTRTIIIAVAFTAVFSEAHEVYHHAKNTPITACPAKEESAINALIRAGADRGEVTRENFGAWIETVPYSYSIYRLPWPVAYPATGRVQAANPPRWLYGETKNLLPMPKGCVPEFHGETFALLRCEKRQ